MPKFLLPYERDCTEVGPIRLRNPDALPIEALQTEQFNGGRCFACNDASWEIEASFFRHSMFPPIHYLFCRECFQQVLHEYGYTVIRRQGHFLVFSITADEP